MGHPSRHMPKYEKKILSIKVFFLIILIALVCSLFLSIFVSKSLWLLSAFFAIIFLSIFDESNKKHYEQLFKGREGETICSFSKYFDTREVDPWVIRAVYEQLQNYISIDKEQKFPIRPDDRIIEDLKIDDEDLVFDLFFEISKRTERSLKNQKDNPFYDKISTVTDVVYFFNEQPKI